MKTSFTTRLFWLRAWIMGLCCRNRTIRAHGCLIALCVFLSGSVLVGPVSACAADSAVVLLYHRFGEDSYPDTNIRIDQLDDHIAILKQGNYAVWPLTDIVEALQSGQPVPEQTIAITIDDAFRSVYDHAWPRLRDAGFPFTVFVATDPVDAAAPDFMTWDQIRTLHDHGVTIASHTASHLHMADASVAENRAEIERSQARLREELGTAPVLFSFPYGESNSEAIEVVRQAGYRAAFGQQSGVVYPGADFFLLPRFALNELYGRIDRFKMIINTLPLPVTDFLPRSMMIGATAPVVGFTVDPSVGPLEGLGCYSWDGSTAAIEAINRRVEVRLTNPMPPGRSRLNCTLPTPEGNWRWLGALFYRPQ